MSTPSVTILKNLVLNWESNQMEEETIATFYRHYDGCGRSRNHARGTNCRDAEGSRSA